MLRRQGQKHRTVRAPEREVSFRRRPGVWKEVAKFSVWGRTFPICLAGSCPRELFLQHTPHPYPMPSKTLYLPAPQALHRQPVSPQLQLPWGQEPCASCLFLPPFPFSLSCSFALFASLSVSTRHSPLAQETGISVWPHASSNIQGVGLG